MTANPVLLQKKYARIVVRLAEKEKVSLAKALSLFYFSDTYNLVSCGTSDMHCMSDDYIVEEIQDEYHHRGWRYGCN